MLIRAWVKHQDYTGPWQLRAETRLAGESWTARWKPEKPLSAEQTRTSATAGQILAEVKRAVTDAHGPSPYCDLRFVCYRQGHSKDADVIDVTRVVRPVTDSDMLPALLDPGLAVTLAQKGLDLAAAALHEQSVVIAALSQQNAAVNQHHASLATTRAVGSTSADIGTSLMSFAAGVGLVVAWPKIREKLGLKNDDEVIDVLVGTLKGQTDRLRVETARDARQLEQRDELPVYVEPEREAVPALPGDSEDLPELEVEPLDSEPVLPADADGATEYERPEVNAGTIRDLLARDPERASAMLRELVADPEVLAALDVPPPLRAMVAGMMGGAR